ncbi:MAG: ceramidase domain-containing protein [Bradymonadia bacterium]
MNDPIDLYCERLGPGLWAEPLNAVSNLAFVLMALWLWRRCGGRGDRAVNGLIALVGVIGVGSGLFHTFATRWAQAADVIPIGIFVLLYLALAVRRFFKRSWGLAALIVLAFVGISAGVSVVIPRSALGGGASYLPVIAVLLIMARLLVGRGHPAGPWVARAAGAFVLSYAARTLDGPLCEALPVGTHWAWHLLNGVVLGLLVWGMAGPTRALCGRN